jgi:iron complex outermembrane recepter protein
MFKKTKVCTAALAALGGSLLLHAVPAVAQQTQRIEITGSAIKRIDAETAVPVTVLKVEELRAQGVTSIEQIMNSLSAVQMSQGSSQQVGAGTGGAAFADLRGLGANKTLILLNGRRVANNAIDGSAVDLNMIPFAAIERVEVVRDGASSLYGSDAIGGVINFITRNDFTGGVITIGADKPKVKGGNSSNANIGFGFGDLSRQGFNVFGFLDMNKQDPIGGLDRPFNARQPGGLSPTPFPANYYQNGDVTANPSAPDCTSPAFLTPSGDGTSCFIKTASFVDYTPKSDRTSAMVRATVRLGDVNLFAEGFVTKNEATTRIAPVPYGVLYMNPRRPDGTVNPYFPGATATSIKPAFTINPAFTQANMSPRTGVTLQPGFIIVKWRALDGGQRTSIAKNDQSRFLLGADGVLAGWDYQAGFSVNENKIADNVTGYSDGVKINQGVANGVINPFGDQSAAGNAFIQDALLGGNLQNHKGKVSTGDLRASRELGDWLGAGRSAAVAVGFEARREDFVSAANPPVAALLVASTGVDPDSRSEGKRNVTAVYSELSLPLLKSLDLTASFRYDKYSDFGNSTNPKLSLRFKPMSELLMRASYSTGFRAPSLYELNAVPSYTNTGTVSDPINCPDGKKAIPGKSTALNCNVQFQRLTGGNVSLQPEKSKNLSIGLVLEPVAGVTLGLDYWSIKLDGSIAALSETTVLGDTTAFGRYIKRNAGGNLSIDGSSCPGSDCGFLDLRQQNLGKTNTSGFDVSADFRRNLGDMGKVALGFKGTHVSKYEYQDFIGGPFNQNVGVYVGTGAIFRIQHATTASWTLGNVTLGAVARYKSGYADQDPENTVTSYSTGDVYLSWAAFKGFNFTLGINNVRNVDPPYSNQGEVFQANYDPRYADVVGRKYYVRASYQF